MTEHHPPSSDAAATRLAHHDADGRFRNPWPASGTHGLRDVVRMLWEQRGARVPNPPRGAFPVSAPTIQRPRAPDGVATATWMGHSTVLLQAGGRNILLDPVWSERVSPVQWLGPRRVMPPPIPLGALPPLDVVLVSHSHYDHLDEATVSQLARRHPDAHWVAPLRLGGYLRDFGVTRVSELDWWQECEVAGIRITATPARHFSARRAGDRNATLWCGYCLDVQGRRAYFVGDSASHPEFADIGARCGPFDLVMMPIGAYEPRWFMQIVHMNPEEAVQALEELISAHPHATLPLMLGIHWGTFRLTSEPMDEPPRRAIARWAERMLPRERLWVASFGETRSW